MTFDDETLMAYVDGELDAPARAAVEAAMTADPALAQRVARQQALRARLRQAFDPVLAEPVPERLVATARGAATPGVSAKVTELRRARRHWSWPQLAAMAASLLIGVLLGPWLLHSPTPLVARNGALLASGTLADALTGQLARSQPASAPVQIGVSFRSRSGNYCRTFLLRDTSELAGLACLEHGDWKLEALAATEPGVAGSGYRPAGSALPPAIAASVDALMSGEPLDAAGESAARERGWSR